MTLPHSDALVFFGATGDLAYKKIFPALQAMAKLGRLNVPVIGVAKAAWNLDQLKTRARDSVEKHGGLDSSAFDKLCGLLRYVDGDYNDPATFQSIRKELGPAQRPAHYLAIPPVLFGLVVEQLAKSGCNKGARVIVEKPFGRDLASAQELSRILLGAFDERSIFRIDHYLGKKPVHNMLFFRFANASLETFFIFSDYARPAIRLSALMELPCIFVFTHEAMGDGEDGPTHQPVEQMVSLRAVPGLVTLRPCDANEVVEAYRYIMRLRHQPAVLALSRQPLPTLDRSKYASASGLARGAYVLADVPGGNPELILIATGSEVSLVVEAHDQLLAEGIRSRVVSMPSWDIFEHQSREYRDTVLPPNVKARVAVEQGSTLGWDRYVGAEGRVIGMHTFGASAPLKELQNKFGFEPDRVVAVAKEILGSRQAN
jgi:hypothetical protein